MQRQRPLIFLSHNCQDKDFVRRLSSDLRRSGAHTWVDEAEIRIGEPLLDKVREAINSVDYLAVVLTLRSVRSEWVQRELQIAKEQSHVKILPILLEWCDVPAFLVGTLHADFTTPDRYQTALKTLLHAVNLPRRFDPTLLNDCLTFMEKTARRVRPPNGTLESMNAHDAGIWLLEHLTPVDYQPITLLESTRSVKTCHRMTET